MHVGQPVPFPPGPGECPSPARVAAGGARPLGYPHPGDPGAQEAMGGGVKVVTPRLLLPAHCGRSPADASRLVSQLLFQGVLLGPPLYRRGN